MDVSGETQAAIIFNQEYCRINFIFWDRRQNQIELRKYFKTLVSNQRANGGSSLKLPGEVPGLPVAPVVIEPAPPVVVPPPLPVSDSLGDVLVAAQALVDRIRALMQRS